jgi:hypothetical protein
LVAKKIIESPIIIPIKKATARSTMNAGVVKVIIVIYKYSIVYYKYESGLRYPARGATGILILVPHTLLT